MKRILIIILLLYLVVRKENKPVKHETKKPKIVFGNDNMIDAVGMGARLSKADAG